MNDDDLTRDLETWGAATDPASDPITADEVAGRPDVAPSRRRRGSRGLVAAAVVLVVIGIGAAIAVVGDDGGGEGDGVVADDGGSEADDRGTPVQVVVDGTALGPAPSHDRFVVTAGCDRSQPTCRPVGRGVASGPLLPGTSLVLHQRLRPGRWTVWFETRPCPAAGCGPVSPDGVPLAAGADAVSCGVDVEVAITPVRAVVEITGPLASSDGPGCALVPAEPAPTLTVPPAWSVRDPLPWRCPPQVGEDGEVLGPDDGRASAAVAECAGHAWADGDPTEVPTVEIDPEWGAQRVWWRLLDDADGRRVDVIRGSFTDGVDASWTKQTCAGFDAAADPPGPIDCGAEEILPLDLPPVVSGAPTPATTDPSVTTTTPSDSTIDIVLDTTDLPRAPEPITWTWGVHLGDTDVAVTTGSVTGDDADGYLGQPIALVADDLAVPDGTEWVGVRIDGSEGTANLCIGPPADDGARVLVIDIAPRGCTPEWVVELPPLTVPPTWSLRAPATECVDLAPTSRWGQCLSDLAMAGGAVAEWSTSGAGVLTTYRVDDGEVAIVRRAITPDSIDWTRQVCAGIEPADAGRGLDPSGCGPEEPMSLDP